MVHASRFMAQGFCHLFDTQIYTSAAELSHLFASHTHHHSGHRFEPSAKDSVRFKFGQIWENIFGISWHFLAFVGELLA